VFFERLVLMELPEDRREVTLDFREIEAIIGSTLPKSAYAYSAWWSNDGRLTAMPPRGWR